jgi:hypothetical protein
VPRAKALFPPRRVFIGTLSIAALLSEFINVINLLTSRFQPLLYAALQAFINKLMTLPNIA